MKTRRSLPPAVLEMVAARFRVLGEPLRVRILEALHDGEQNVSSLVAATGATQSNVSKHLRSLEQAGLIGRRQVGNQVFCFIDDRSVFELCEVVCASLGRRLSRHARLGAALRRVNRRSS